MRTTLYVAAFLIVAVGIAHSYLGERYILIRLFRRENLPELFGSAGFTIRTLRFASRSAYTSACNSERRRPRYGEPSGNPAPLRAMGSLSVFLGRLSEGSRRRGHSRQRGPARLHLHGVARQRRGARAGGPTEGRGPHGAWRGAPRGCQGNSVAPFGGCFPYDGCDSPRRRWDVKQAAGARSRRIRPVWACAIAAVVLAGPTLGAQDPPEEIDALRAFTTRALERARVRGASVALLREGEIVWVESFGVKDERSGEPVTPDTVFEAASLGKVVAAYAAFLLVEEGRWSLDMPARAPSLEVDPGCEAPSLLHLLSHTAGLSNDLAASQYRPACDSGTSFSYAGQGYLVLQDLFAAQTGGTSERFIQERLFRPLGMERSSYEQPDGKDLATGHVDLVFGLLSGKAQGAGLPLGWAAVVIAGAACLWVSRGTWRRFAPGKAIALIALEWVVALLVLVAAGSAAIVPIEPSSTRVLLPASLYSTANDLARFSQELLRPQLMRPATRDLMFAPRVDVNARIAWGAGIGVDHSEEPITYWQWGSNPGFQGLLVLDPVRGDAVVVLTNTGGFLDVVSTRTGGYNLSKQIARRALGINGSWDLYRSAPQDG